MYKINIRRLWKLERRRQTSQGQQDPSSGSKEQQDTEFSGFSFSPIYPRLGAEDAINPETPKGAAKSLQKRLFSLAKTRKEATQKDRKLLDNSYSTSAKYHRKNFGLTHINKVQVGSPEFYPCKAVMRCPDAPIRVVSEGLRRKLGLSSLSASNNPPSPVVLVELLPPPTSN